jgi:hypothetical protein
MDNIYVEKSKKTPLIHINLKENKFLIKGPSFSENIVDIYNPIIDWIDTNIPNLDTELVCELYFTVLNSASHKKIFQILIRLNSYLDAGKKIKVQWFYDEDDEDIMEMGEDLTELINIPFEIIPVRS